MQQSWRWKAHVCPLLNLIPSGCRRRRSLGNSGEVAEGIALALESQPGLIGALLVPWVVTDSLGVEAHAWGAGNWGRDLSLSHFGGSPARGTMKKAATAFSP
jgi:hypothetical protein